MPRTISMEKHNLIFILLLAGILGALNMPRGLFAETIPWNVPGTPAGADWMGSGALFSAVDKTGNFVNVNADLSGRVYGGYDYLAGDGAVAATGNTLTVGNVSVSGHSLGGYAYITGSAATNQAEASHNTVHFAASSAQLLVAGGYVSIISNGAGVANDNTLNISIAAPFAQMAYGAYAVNQGAGGTLQLSANALNMENMTSSSSAGGVYAAKSSGGSLEATGNTANITNSTFTDTSQVIAGADIRGSQAVSIDFTANQNSINLTGASSESSVRGASISHIHADGAGSAEMTENAATLDSHVLNQYVYGAYVQFEGSADVNLTVNRVELKNSSSAGGVYGGYANIRGAENVSVNVSAGIVTVTGSSTVNGEVYGGWANALAGQMEVNGNTATINSSSSVANNVFGGRGRIENAGTVESSGNTVRIEGGSSVSWDVNGGYAFINNSDSDSLARANGNTIYTTASQAGGTVTGATVWVNKDGKAEGNQNSVNISQGSSLEHVYGANVTVLQEGSVEASQNTVTIEDSTFDGEIYAAYGSINGDGILEISDNKVIAERSYFHNYVQAASTASNSDSAIDYHLNRNSVKLTQSELDYDAFGVYAGNWEPTAQGSVEFLSNTVEFDNSQAAGGAYGVYYESLGTIDVTIADSTVSLTDGASASEVTGAYAESAEQVTVSTNSGTVTITDSSVTTGWVAGGYSLVGSGTARSSGNTVEMTRSSANDEVFASRAEIGDNGTVQANLNSVTLTDASVEGAVTAAQGITGYGGVFMSTNSVIVNDSTLQGNIGAVGVQGTSAGETLYFLVGNTISMTDSSTPGDVWVVSAEESDSGAEGSLSATRNSAELSGTSITGVVYGVKYASKGDSSATITQSGVALSDGSSASQAVAASAEIEGDGSASANSGHVSVADSVVTSDGALGGLASVRSGTAESNGNTLEIVSSTVTGAVGGGFSYVDQVGSAYSDGNTVLIEDSEISGSVTGGIVEGNGTTSSLSATGNEITLSGSASLTGGSPAVLAGGFSSITNSSDDLFTDNVLKIVKPADGGITVNAGGVFNFQRYSFLYSKDAGNGAVAVKYTGSGAVLLNDGVSEASVVESVDIEEGGAMPQTGYRYVLVEGSIQTTDGAGDELFTQTEVSGRLGQYVELEYGLEYESDGSSLVAVLKSVGARADAKSLPEAFLAGSILVNRASDLAAEKGVPAAVVTAEQAVSWHIFNVFSISRLRYETGSHVDADSFSLLLGATKGFDSAPGRFIFGAFIEAGWGNYDTYNSRTGREPDLHGTGKTRYLGGGILGRFEFSGFGPGRFYLEGSARLGRVKSDFSSQDLPSPIYKHELSTGYYGFHFGVGSKFSLSESSELDVLVKYTHTTRKGKNVFTPSGAPVSFKDADSRRIKIGARLNLLTDGVISPYFGLGFERELDGKAEADVYGIPIDNAPRMKGNTVSGEAGVTVRFSPDSPFSLAAGFQGYTGQMEGVSASVQLKLEF